MQNHDVPFSMPFSVAEINSPERCQIYADQVVMNIRARIQNFQPEVMLVLGTGCGTVAECIGNKTELSYTDIGLPPCSVSGHVGKLVFGIFGGRNIVGFQGRRHVYEGVTPHVVSLPMYVAKELGVKYAVLTSAVGLAPLPSDRDTSWKDWKGPEYSIAQPGDILLVKSIYREHFPTASLGSVGGISRFFGSMDMPSRALRLIAEEALAEKRLIVGSCVYVPRIGSGFETPAEVSELMHLAAVTKTTCVGGMSLVPELEAGQLLGLPSLALAVVTNNCFDMQASRDIDGAVRLFYYQKRINLVDMTLSEVQTRVDAEVKTRQPTHEEVSATGNSPAVTQKLEQILETVIRAVKF